MTYTNKFNKYSLSTYNVPCTVYKKDQNRLTNIPVLKPGFTEKGHQGTMQGDGCVLCHARMCVI